MTDEVALYLLVYFLKRRWAVGIVERAGFASEFDVSLRWRASIM